VAACRDLSWLLARGYSSKAAVKLIGDRYSLDERQRQAVRRATCTPEQRRARTAAMLPADKLGGARLLVDGFNVLTTVEAALSGGAVLSCDDGCFRDLASMHGTWRRVDETEPAVRHIGDRLARWGIGEVIWFLDRPVGNSGRLAAQLRELAAKRSWPWQVELVSSPDRELRQTEDPIATADSAVIDAGGPWINLARWVVEALPDVWMIELAGGANMGSGD